MLNNYARVWCLRACACACVGRYSCVCRRVSMYICRRVPMYVSMHVGPRYELCMYACVCVRALRACMCVPGRVCV